MLEDFCRLVFQLFLAGSGLYFTWISCCAFGPLFCGISGSLSFLGGVAISKINVKNSLVPPPTCKNCMYIRNLSMQFYPLSVTTVTRLPNLCKGWRFSLGLFGLLWSPLVCPRIWEPAGLLAYLGWPWLWEGGLAVLSSCRLAWLCFREIAQAQEQKQKCRAFFKPGLCLLRAHWPQQVTWPSPVSGWEGTKQVHGEGLHAGKGEGLGSYFILPRLWIEESIHSISAQVDEIHKLSTSIWVYLGWETEAYRPFRCPSAPSSRHFSTLTLGVIIILLPNNID